MAPIAVTHTIGSVVRNGITKLFSHFRLRGRWSYGIVLALAFATVILIAVQSYRAIDRELTEVALSRRAAVAQLAAVTLSEKFARLVDLATSFTTRPRVHELVAEGKWVEASKFLQAVPHDFPFIERLFLADLDGTLKVDVPELPGVRGLNFSGREWYQGVSRDWRPYVSPVYRRTAAPQLNVFAVAVPIMSASGKVVGILLLQIRAESLLEWVKTIDFEPQGFVYLIDSKGQIAFHSKKPGEGEIVDLSAAPIVQSLQRGEHGVQIAFDRLEGEDQISAYAPVPGYGWGVITHQPARASLGLEARDDQLRLLLTAYGLVLLLCVSGVFLALRIALERRRAEEDRRLKAELERRVAERTVALKESEQRLNLALDSAQMGAWDLDLIADKAVRSLRHDQIFGYDSLLPEWGAGIFMTHVVPEDREQVKQCFENAFATGSFKMECRIIRRDGALRWIEAEGRAYRDEKGQPVRMMGVVADITERKNAEEQISALNTDLELRARQLEVANKELESFSYSVSHDLRSPLRAIDGFSRLLQEDHDDKLNDESRRLLGVIRDSSQKMGQLIDDLLAFSRLGRKPLSNAGIDMNRLVKDVLSEMGTASGRLPELMLGALPMAHGDAVLVKQVWFNLLSNAVKFSGRCEQPVIEVSGRENGEENIYSVKDNGAGFDMRYYDKLFGVFQRLHRTEEFAGTGVGLAIVQRVVLRHGGRVWAEGKVDEGAAFYFSLPRGKPDGHVRES